MKQVTNNYQLALARSFVSTVQDPDRYFYMTAGQHLPWIDEDNPPVENHSIENIEYSTYDNMIFGKRVASADVSLMIERRDWVYNTIYTRYDGQDPDLFKKEYYVTVASAGQRHVFICLDNNKNSPSTFSPAFEDTTPAEPFYFTADGYQWKYMFSVTDSTFNKFSSDGFMPVVPNPDVTSNAVHGAIETIIVEAPGSNYHAYTTGNFQEVTVAGNNVIMTIEPSASANTDFYKGSAIKIVQGPGAGQQRTVAEYSVAGGQKRVILDRAFNVIPTTASKYEITPRVLISGDGVGCEARAVVNPAGNTIAHIEVSHQGAGYSYADAVVIGNTGFTSASLNPETAELRVILGPPGGFGKDVAKTLHCKTAGLSAMFANSEMSTIPAEGTYRTISVLSNPLFNDVELTLSDITGYFLDAETLTSGAVTGEVKGYIEAVSILRMTNVLGVYKTGDIITGPNGSATIDSIRISGAAKNGDTADQRTRLIITPTSVQQFIPNEMIVQQQTYATGMVDQANTTHVCITNVRGTFNTSDINDNFPITGMTSQATADVTGLIHGDFVKNSGNILYLDNITSVQRDPSSSETIKLIITFDAK